MNTFLFVLGLFSFTILGSVALVVPRRNSYTRGSTTALAMAVVPPSDSSVVGVVGRGYVSVLTAKLSALAGYKTWMLYPSGQEETIHDLLGDNDVLNSNLELVDSSDVETWQGKHLPQTDALIFAVDADVPLESSVVEYMVTKDSTPNLKRVVAMSRNLNGKDLGFLVKASKVSANAEVWDGSSSQQYKSFEATLQSSCKTCGSDYTIVRAGTLKGGARGVDEEPYEQFLSKKYYEMTKKDIITWQLLFDCNVRGVTLCKGDVMPGPGGRAIFSATSSDAVAGDSSRCGVAEAMVRSLAVDSACNADFGIGTASSRTPPTDAEWDKLFSVL